MIRQYVDETKKSEYMHRILEIFYRHGRTESAPWIAERINALHREFWGYTEDYTEQKRKYNRLLLDRESEIEKRVKSSADPLRECWKRQEKSRFLRKYTCCFGRNWRGRTNWSI